MEMWWMIFNQSLVINWSYLYKYITQLHTHTELSPRTESGMKCDVEWSTDTRIVNKQNKVSLQEKKDWSDIFLTS